MQFTKHALQPRLIAAAVAAACALPAHADSSLFELGTVQVTGERSPSGEIEAEQVSSVISAEDIERFSRTNVGDAVNLLSGVSISTNSRNEKMVYLRGYDARQAPLFIDGIPVYVPYDGYVDMNRFTTADLSAIQVVKGFSSVAFGPNTLGGAINLISRKPTRKLEGDVSLGVGSGHERRAALNVGTNQGMWYAQAGLSYDAADYFPMASGFSATTTENGGHRENSAHRDSKVSLKLGLTPNATDEYALSYYRQDGEKGQPPSTDPAAARYWQWPYWDKESLYFVSRTALGDKEMLKVRLFRDTFDNDLRIYSDASYTTYNPVSGVSVYHDKSNGASVELSSIRLPAQEIKLIASRKSDEHKSVDGAGATGEAFKDVLTSYAIEDNIRLGQRWLLSLGLSRHSLEAEHVFKSGWPAFDISDEKRATDGQAALFFDLDAKNRLYASIAEKTRLPTLKDRFSLRFGRYVENPDLKPESSINYEIGYQGTPWRALRVEAALFHSRIDDKIQSVFLVPGTTACSNAKPCQMQNVGEVKSSGVELGLRTPLANWLDVGANYTYLRLKNVSDSSIKITDVPRQKLSAFAIARFGDQLELLPYIESETGRWASNSKQLGGFTTFNLKLTYRPQPALALEAGVSNAGDKQYETSDGFPSPGRMYYANLRYSF